MRRIAPLLAALTAACEAPRNAVRVTPAAIPDSVRFSVVAADGTNQPLDQVYGLSVVRCGTEDSYWTITAGGARELPAVVHYGQVIPGFQVRVGPRPLSPGCYEVIASSARPVRFTIASPSAPPDIKPYDVR